MSFLWKSRHKIDCVLFIKLGAVCLAQLNYSHTISTCGKQGVNYIKMTCLCTSSIDHGSSNLSQDDEMIERIITNIHLYMMLYMPEHVSLLHPPQQIRSYVVQITFSTVFLLFAQFPDLHIFFTKPHAKTSAGKMYSPEFPSLYWLIRDMYWVSRVAL